MSQDHETLDHVIPYVRKAECATFVPKTVKFMYEETVKSTRKTKKTDEQGQVTAIEEEIESDKDRKVTLTVFAQGDQEDCEHFFEAFEKLQHELASVWEQCSATRKTDATVLFDAFEKMLDGLALTEWRNVLLADRTKTTRSWEDFKEFVSTYIVTKVLAQDDPYNRQRTYMMERTMPKGMTVRGWWLRKQTLNRYLVYFFKTLAEMKRWFPTADFPKWWKVGGLSNQELRAIVVNRIPRRFKEILQQTDIGRKHQMESETEDLVDYFATLQRQEQNIVSRRPGRGNQFHYQRRPVSQNRRPVSPVARSVNPYFNRPARHYYQGSANPNYQRAQVSYRAPYGTNQYASGGRNFNRGGFRGGQRGFPSRPPYQQYQRLQQHSGRGQPYTRMRHYQPNQSEATPAYFQHDQAAVERQQHPTEQQQSRDTLDTSSSNYDESQDEEQLINQWNESLFLESSDQFLVDDEAENYSAYDEQDSESQYYVDETYYGEDEDSQYG